MDGHSILPTLEPAHPLMSKASGTWGCGAVTDEGEYFQLKWPDSLAGVDIMIKFPRLSQWPREVADGRYEQCLLTWWWSMSCSQEQQRYYMHLLRCLHFFSARCQISICHRVLNIVADASLHNMGQALAPSTLRVYSTGQRRFQLVCMDAAL